MLQTHKSIIPLLLASVAAATGALNQPHFPVLQGRNLERVDVAIPQELPGQLKLIVFGFEREHQRAINTWIPRCEALESQVQGFRFFEVPFLAGRYRLFRSWIDGGMRRGISDPAARKRTITVYGGRSAAMNQLGVKDLGMIHLFLIAPTGEILWKSEGPWSPQKEESLRTVLGSS